MPGLYFHLGAHRTATGSFQEFLSLNQDRLRAHGVNAVFSNRDGTQPGNLRLKLPKERHFSAGDLAKFEHRIERQIARN